MHRRNMLAALFGGGAMAAAATAASSTNAAAPDSAKVVYHLDELDKVDFVLGNIDNHYKGMGGPGKVTIALVVHGPALKAFHAAGASPDMSHRTGELKKSGLELNACINTMHAQKVTLNELLPGFIVPTKAAWCGSRNCRAKATSICGRDSAFRAGIFRFAVARTQPTRVRFRPCPLYLR